MKPPARALLYSPLDLEHGDGREYPLGGYLGPLHDLVGGEGGLGRRRQHRQLHTQLILDGYFTDFIKAVDIYYLTCASPLC